MPSQSASGVAGAGRHPRILAIAYACMPGVGSEPGAGFAWVRILGGIGDTWVLTRPWPARAAELAAAVAAAPESRTIHIVELNLPRWIGSREWDPFRSGHQRLEYVVWQLAALRAARQLVQRHEVDLVWHVTFANIWMGTIGGLLGRPFVLGPVGGGVGPAWRLLPGLGWRGILFEMARSLSRTGGRWLNPLARSAWSRAQLILVLNRETLQWLPRAARSRACVFNNIVLETDLPSRTRKRAKGEHPVALYAGRLIPWKGVALAIRALFMLPDWRLVVLGSGPDEARLRGIATELGVVERIEFRGWVARDEMLRVMSEEADVFVFPSLHDDSPWAVGEAMAIGLPVVCLDRGGPPAIVGNGVPIAGERVTVQRLARAIVEAADQQPGPAVSPTVERRRAELVTLLEANGIVVRDWSSSLAGPPA